MFTDHNVVGTGTAAPDFWGLTDGNTPDGDPASAYTRAGWSATLHQYRSNVSLSDASVSEVKNDGLQLLLLNSMNVWSAYSGTNYYKMNN
jgi:hypothetical protein